MFTAAFIRRLRDYREQKDGVSAIEFALVAPVFLGILLSLFELSFVMLRSTMVDNAMDVASKEIYTGDISDRAAFEQLICNHLALYDNCTDVINVEAFEIASFSDIPSSEAECIDTGDENFSPTTEFSTGNSSSIMFVRICMTTPIITPGLGFGASLPKLNDGNYGIVASTVFSNEPY